MIPATRNLDVSSEVSSWFWGREIAADALVHAQLLVTAYMKPLSHRMISISETFRYARILTWIESEERTHL